MKADRAHTVPLSLQAVEVIERARALKRDESLVFSRRGRDGKRRGGQSGGGLGRAPGSSAGSAPRGRPIVAHGFRATFRVWAIEVARARREICEPALAHGESDATVGAYTDDADPFADRTEADATVGGLRFAAVAGPGVSGWLSLALRSGFTVALALRLFFSWWPGSDHKRSHKISP